MGALDNINEFNNIGMLQCLEKMILPLDFYWFDRHEHFNGYFLFIFDVTPLENMWVPTSSDFMRDSVLLEFSWLGKKYPQGSSILS